MTIETISRMPGTSLADLGEISAGIQEYVRAANAETQQAAMEAMGRRGLIQRVFPTQYERERQRLGVQALRQVGESKREMLELYARTQIEIARKRADAVIAAQGMHLQEQLASFANAKIESLNATINQTRERFLASMDPQFSMIEKYQGRPELYEPAHKAVLHQIQVYFDSNAALLDGFAQSLCNKMGQAQP